MDATFQHLGRMTLRYGFLMDQTKCIGCHACTVACKSEHDVPLGVFRTWVQYTETGVFPNTEKHFQVNRCNHCENAPCVTICPTGALFVRPDGIVDFDDGRCIGCKACIAACPYDAIYIDPEERTAAKCNYCAHRVDRGMLPACVVVCPEEAIVAGDLDDPDSLIARLLREHPTAVRKPERGTRPKVFYLGADPSTLDPTRSAVGDGYIFAERAEPQPIPFLADGTPPARRLYDAPHLRRPWGPFVSFYLWTKSLAAGTGGLAALLALLAPRTLLGQTLELVAPIFALFFLLVTAGLLIADLKRPERFWYLLVRPHTSSWLVRGGILLTVYGALLASEILVVLLHGRPPVALLLLLVRAGVGTAGYTAFLCRQAEARVFWHEPWAFWHLLDQAAIAGASALLIVAGSFVHLLGLVLVVALALHGIAALAAVLGPARAPEAEIARREVVRGGYRRLFWVGALGAGVLLALLLLSVGLLALTPFAFAGLAFGLLGLLAYEHLWIEAGQMAPLS